MHFFLPGTALGGGTGKGDREGEEDGVGEGCEVNSSPPQRAVSRGCSVHGKQLRGRRKRGK